MNRWTPKLTFRKINDFGETLFLSLTSYIIIVFDISLTKIKKRKIRQTTVVVSFLGKRYGHFHAATAVFIFSLAHSTRAYTQNAPTRSPRAYIQNAFDVNEIPPCSTLLSVLAPSTSLYGRIGVFLTCEKFNLLCSASLHLFARGKLNLPHALGRSYPSQ